MNALISIVYALIDGFPAGSVVDHILVTVTGSTASQSQSVPPDTQSVIFSGLVADTYTATAQGFPAVGPAFGKPAITTFTLTAPATVSLSLPNSISAVQS